MESFYCLFSSKVGKRNWNNIHRSKFSTLVFVISGDGNHCRIVGSKFELRDISFPFALTTLL